ncbi:Carbohydrate esterase 4 protein [Ceratobasidium sp. 392]|nr:Carbohydrate esterase 4 protein [Ceratobasidium sp. 392]
MVFSVVRFTVLVATLFGAVSAAPVEDPHIGARAAAAVITHCTQPKTVALTFDDGPYVNTTKLVDLLNKNGAKGAASVKYAYDQGHQIASHTWSHAHLASLTGAALQLEFNKTNDAIKKITGAAPAFMRPPFGEYNDEVRQVAGSLGQKVVIWDFDSGDSAGKSASQSKTDYKNWLAKNPNSVLTLNHETYATTVNDVIPYAIQQFKAKGYKMVTVAQCMGQSPYKSTGKPSPRDSTWKC